MERGYCLRVFDVAGFSPKDDIHLGVFAREIVGNSSIR